MLDTLRNWRQLRHNPIYLRESGHWGEPNPYYRQISRYMPFVVLAIVVLGFCCGANSLSAFFGIGELSSVLAVATCIPGAITQAISWAALVLVPALTAPMVIEEKRLGTWEVLRMTPYSTSEIILSKLLGGLARLKIWKPLLLLNAVQLLIGVVVIYTVATRNTIFSTDFVMTVANPLLVLRPWIEIAWIACTGLVFSTIMESGRAALVATYAVVVGFKFLNGWLLWVILALVLEGLFSSALIAGIVSMGPLVGLSLILVITGFVLGRRAHLLEQSDRLSVA